MAEKEGFEPSKLPLFKGKIGIGVYLVCAFVHFFDTFQSFTHIFRSVPDRKI